MALLGCDQRTAKQCIEITEKTGSERLIKLVCNPAETIATDEGAALGTAILVGVGVGVGVGVRGLDRRGMRN